MSESDFSKWMLHKEHNQLHEENKQLKQTVDELVQALKLAQGALLAYGAEPITAVMSDLRVAIEKAEDL